MEATHHLSAPVSLLQGVCYSRGNQNHSLEHLETDWTRGSCPQPWGWDCQPVSHTFTTSTVWPAGRGQHVGMRGDEAGHIGWARAEGRVQASLLRKGPLRPGGRAGPTQAVSLAQWALSEHPPMPSTHIDGQQWTLGASRLGTPGNRRGCSWAWWLRVLNRQQHSRDFCPVGSYCSYTKAGDLFIVSLMSKIMPSTYCVLGNYW